VSTTTYPPTNLTDLSRRLDNYRRHLDRQAGAAKSLAEQGRAAQTRIAELKQQILDLEQAAVTLTSLSEQRQEQIQRTIESLVTYGLRTIFDEDLSFHLQQSVKRGATEVEFIVRTTLADGTTIDTGLLDARGGGLVSVVGFLLRLVILLLSKQPSPTLFLDETFSHVSAEYLDRVAEFLRELADKTKVQIVMVTHQPELAANADVVYRFALQDGRTVVTRKTADNR
jgi:DNA repair ATPase RecN